MKWKGTRSLDRGAHRRVSVPEEHCGCGKGRVVGLWGFLDHEASETLLLHVLTMSFCFPPHLIPFRLFPVLPLTAIFFQVNMPTSVLGAHSPPWQSASWRNTPSRSTEKPWPSPGHGLSACSPHTLTTPPRKLPRPKKWKTRTVTKGFRVLANHPGLRGAGISGQSFFLEENQIQNRDGSSEGRNVESLKHYRNWGGRWGARGECPVPWRKHQSGLGWVLLVERALRVDGRGLESSLWLWARKWMGYQADLFVCLVIYSLCCS